MRWFIRVNDEIIWADSKQELIQKYGSDYMPRSVGFFPANVRDNKILLEKDPAYLSTLKSLPYIERERLLNGNWNVRSSAGNYFRREWFKIIDSVPSNIAGRARFWDRAATEKRSDNDPDASVGLRMSKTSDGIYVVEDVQKLFATPLAVEQAMKRCARADGIATTIGYHQDPGSSGVHEAQSTARVLDGFYVKYSTATGDKEVRAKPISAQCEAGNLALVRAPWNESFIKILENFPVGRHDDEVDALSGCHALLCGRIGTSASVETFQLREPHFGFSDFQKVSRPQLDMI